MSGSRATPKDAGPNVPHDDAAELAPERLAELGRSTASSAYVFTDVARQQREIQSAYWAELEERETKPMILLAQAQERVAEAHERMLPANERIAAEQRALAEVQLEMWRAQEPHRAKINELYLESLRAEQSRIDNTFHAMFQQTKWAGYMFWITFLLGVFLVVASVAAFFVHPDTNDRLIGAFFGAGALSMLAFFLRDPADKVQRAGGKLVQLQIAMLYSIRESQYWSNYFNNKIAASKDVTSSELADALARMRDGVQVIMRQIGESLDPTTPKSGVARPRPKSSPGSHDEAGGLPPD